MERNLEENMEELFDRNFNGGKSGIVEVKIIDVSQLPNEAYRKIVFKDKQGHTLTRCFNYLDENEPGYKKRLEAMGIHLMHFWDVVVEDKQIPLFNTAKEALDTVIDEIFECAKNRKFRILVNYGFKPKHYTHLILNRYVPFIEDASKANISLHQSANAFIE